MNFRKDSSMGQFKWYAIVYAAILIIVALVILTDAVRTEKLGQIVFFGGIIFLILGTLIIILAKLTKTLDAAHDNSVKIERLIAAMEKNHTIMTQISQNTRISETAKSIAFRDADIQSLRTIIFDKLQKQDFDTTYKIIDEIAKITIYTELAEQLRSEADNYQNATDTGRIKQVIIHLEKLFENHQWTKASTLIEDLIKAYPDSEDATAMRQKLVDKKEERKKILLNAWDDAIKRQLTDRSLEILRELDSYLTPNEGLALQEAARDAFKNKLHNLGVRFSLEISEKRWTNAIQTGQQIIRDFPNSRMAHEIRERIDILKQNAQKKLP